MSYLALLLAFKIGVTLVGVSAPLVLAPQAYLSKRSGLGGEAIAWLRLYGVAVNALLVGYASGFFVLASGAFPWGVTIMGLVSNAGAVAALLATGLARRSPILTSAFALIALGLAVSMAAPEAAMAPLL